MQFKKIRKCYFLRPKCRNVLIDWWQNTSTESLSDEQIVEQVTAFAADVPTPAVESEDDDEESAIISPPQQFNIFPRLEISSQL